MEITDILNEYYDNNAQKLRSITDRILRRFRGICQKDYDDFYSIANEVFCDVLKKYDHSGDFDGFLYTCLSNKIKSEITAKNREKRRIDRLSVSIDTPIDEDNTSLADILPSDFIIEKELDDNGLMQDGKVEKFLKTLPKTTRQIIEMKMEDISGAEIKKRLGLTDNEYENKLNQAKAFGNIRILFENINTANDKEETQNMETTILHTSEKSKQKSYSVDSIIKKIDNYTIRFDHPTQREAEQWTNPMKGNLISDILQDNPIPALVFAEQIINDNVVIWDLDGKQRCTNVYNFKKDGYRISKNIRRYLIRYQTIARDKDSKIILDENGLPEYKWEECDIRGKKYSELPNELQEKFNDYTFEVTQYLNCSSEDIAYHISRYNEGKPMNPSQKGLAYLGEEYAEAVKAISNMEFFKDKGGYKVSEFRNGAVNRIVIESVMACNFLNNWKKRQEDMCNFLKENAAIDHFEKFEDMVERLTEVVTDDVADMFNSKDSFLWFGLFSRFINTGLDDKKFIEFMAEFDRSLRSKEINGISFGLLNQKSTKDKNIVIAKIEYMEKLMKDFLGIKREIKNGNFNIANSAINEYVEQFNRVYIVNSAHLNLEADKVRTAMKSIMMVNNIRDLSDNNIQKCIDENMFTKDEMKDILLYLESLNDWSLEIDNNSPILNKKYIPSLIKIVEYMFINEIEEIDFVNWLKWFAGNCNIKELKNNCQYNYEYMFEKLKKYLLCSQYKKRL